MLKTLLRSIALCGLIASTTNAVITVTFKTTNAVDHANFIERIKLACLPDDITAQIVKAAENAADRDHGCFINKLGPKLPAELKYWNLPTVIEIAANTAVPEDSKVKVFYCSAGGFLEKKVTWKGALEHLHEIDAAVPANYDELVQAYNDYADSLKYHEPSGALIKQSKKIAQLDRKIADLSAEELKHATAAAEHATAAAEYAHDRVVLAEIAEKLVKIKKKNMDDQRSALDAISSGVKDTVSGVVDILKK